MQYEVKTWTLKTVLLAALLCCLWPPPGKARVELAPGVFLDGYIRPRIEVDDRDFDASTGPDQYSTLRTRLGITVEDIIPDTVIYVLIADSRTMGYSDPYLTGEPMPPNNLDTNLGVNQAWILVRNLGWEGAYLKAGRMTNNQGRNRLFGPGNWSHNGPRVYDGVKAGFQNDAHQVNLWSFYGLYGDRHWYPDPSQYPEHQVPDPAIDYKYDHTLHGTDIRLWDQKVQFLFFVDYDQARVEDITRNEKNPGSVRYTAAVYTGLSEDDDWKNKGGLRADLDLAWQFGTVGTTMGEARISAWLAAGDLAYSFGGTYAPWFGVGCDATSGDGGANHNEVHYFYDYYYSKHKLRGHMDYFKNPFKEPSLGLREYIVRTGFKPVKTVSITAEGHYFRTEQPFVSQDDGEDARELGYELDLTGKWKMRPGLMAESGFDVFWATTDWQGPHINPSYFFYSAIIATF